MRRPLIDVPGVRLFIFLDLGRSENSPLDIASAAFATSADIEHLGLDRGHRTLVISREDGNVVAIVVEAW